MTDTTEHTQHGTKQELTADDIRAMTPEEAMIAGAEADDVHIVHRRNRFPIRGTKAEKRASGPSP